MIFLYNMQPTKKVITQNFDIILWAMEKLISILTLVIQQTRGF